MDTLANCIAILFVLQFVWSYYWNCYRKGYTIDVWHFAFLTNLFAIHVMLPFSRSDLNAFALGPSLLRRTQAHVDQAYFITAFGYACMLIGGSLWRMNVGLGLRNVASRLLELPTTASLFLLRSRLLLLTNGIAALVLSSGVLAFYFKTLGFGLNLRSLLITTPWLRPIAQFAAFYSILVGSYCLARYYRLKERSMLVVFLLLVFSQLFFGERSNLVGLASMTLLVVFLKMGRRLTLTRFFSGIAAALMLTLVLSALREPDFSLSRSLASFALNIFYGNSFSDVRDFAVVLSFWDGQHFYGLTYLAGLLAFVPRVLSPFRDKWAIGVVTARLAGFSPLEHPGLRVGPFGEAFFNFGWLGVLLLGLLIGALIRLVDLRMKQALNLLPDRSMLVFSYFILFVILGTFENSSNASTVYTIMMIFAFSWFVTVTARMLKIRV